MPPFFFLTAFFAASATADPVVSNVSVAQREGTKLVDIRYDLTGGTPRSTVTLSVSNSGTPLAAPSVTGDVGAGIADGTGKALVWDGGADADDLLASLTFSLLAVGEGGSGPSGDTYLVIDLSGGASATSYPVTELADVPAGGWTSVHKTSSLVLRRIPAGTFTMGSPSGELGRDSDETQHQVTLTEDFYLGVFEVTQRQWELVMGTSPSYFTGDERPVEQVSYNDIRGASAGAGWPGSDAVDADSFMGRLRARTGLALDLPTESQWEYACRAGTVRAYNDQTANNGEGSGTEGSGTDANLEPLAWYYGNSGSTTHAVGGKQANAWGLYDMHGNVWEWCLDWYGSYPGAVSDPAGASSGSYRVFRGGSWYLSARSCRSASRYRSVPSARYNYYGLRVGSAPPVQ